MQPQGTEEGLPQLSGQGPLLRIGITCAAIVIGSAIVGSQLSTGNLSQVLPSVADEDDAGTLEDDSYAGSGDEVLGRSSKDIEGSDIEASEEVRDESGGEDSEDLAEVTEEESAEEPFANEREAAPEGEAGDPAAAEPAEEESDDGEGGWIIGPTPDP